MTPDEAPATLVLGIGCSTAASVDEMEALVRTTLLQAGLAFGSVRLIATIDRRVEHPAIRQVAASAGVRVVGFTPHSAGVVDSPSPSNAVLRQTHGAGVCEQAALLGSDAGTLIVPKQKSAYATVAVARDRRSGTKPHESR